MDPQTSLLSAADVHSPRAAAAHRRRGARWILAAARAWCRLDAYTAQQAESHPHRFLQRVAESAERLSGALWTTALDIEEKAWLTIRIYEDSPAFRAPGNDLFEIESALFAKHLARPPARILVGACGTGREAVALAAQGYDVVAFDPAEDCVVESGRRLAGRAGVRRLSYEQLSAIVLDGGVDDALRVGRFDAVVLGCGSLSHVLDRREQRRLMQALQVLCPVGPIIGSFLWAEQPAAPSMGRAARLGSRIGRAIARLRGLAPGDDEHLSYRARRGFAYTFSRREMEDLALGIRRCVTWERHAARPSLYATLVPIDASARAASS